MQNINNMLIQGSAQRMVAPNKSTDLRNVRRKYYFSKWQAVFLFLCKASPH